MQSHEAPRDGVPPHYRGDGDVTCSRAMESMTHGAYLVCRLSPMQVWWWCCAFKYLWRWPRKGGREDLAKCMSCVQHLVDDFISDDAMRYDP